MSLGIYPVFEPKIAEAKFGVLGETLASSFERLDEIAERHGLIPFTAFRDNREVPADFDGSPDDLEELLGPFNEWFDPESGAKAFEALADLIKSNREEAKRFQYPQDVVEELEELVRVLRIAEKRNARFRLEMS